MGSRIHRRAAAGARTRRICELQDVAGLGPRRPRRALRLSDIATANGRA
jgi:hypothetical protein